MCAYFIAIGKGHWALGNLDFDGVREDIPNAISRLSTNLDPRNYDLSGIFEGVGGDRKVGI